MDYLQQDNKCAKVSHSSSPLMEGETLWSGLPVRVHQTDMDDNVIYSGVGMIISWTMDELDLWLQVLCGDRMLQCPMHYGGEYGTPTVVSPL